MKAKLFSGLLVFLAIFVFSSQLFPVFAKEIPPVYESIDPYLTTPAPGHLYEIPVVIMRFLPTIDGENLDVTKAPDYWHLGEISLEELKTKIDVFDKRIKFMLEEGSKFRGYKDSSAPPTLGYRVVEYITIYEQTPPGPVTGHEKGYALYAPDFHRIFDRFNIEHYINELRVKEIWVWMGGVAPGFPSYDPALHKPENFRGWWESNMSSPLTGDISNSNRGNADLPIYNSTYTVYGQNFRRTQAEAVHNHGHQLEAILSHVNHLQYGNTDLFWKKFVGKNQIDDFITGRAGWTHMPPNTTKHYDYTGTRTLINSDIEDWTPDNRGARKLVNFNTYGNLKYPWPDPNPADIPQRVESQWYIYWMQSMPGHGNQIQYSNRDMTNWWVFTADWDAAISSQMGLVSQNGTELPQLRDRNSDRADRSIDLDAQDLSLLPDLKSKVGTTETNIIFVNRTGVEIAYYWVDYEGNEIFYSSLAADTSVNRPTYEGHIWLVKDADQRNLAVFRALKQTGRAIIDMEAPPSPVVHIGPAQRPPMYWVDIEAGTLHRLVGAEVENLAPNVTQANSIALDTDRGKLYWTEKIGQRTGQIRRANLDGTNVQLVKALTSVPLYLTLDTAGGKLYLINTYGKVQRMNLDGSNYQTDLITGLKTPKGLALDVGRDKIYWIEQTGDNTGKIRRANLNGSNVSVVKNLTSPPLSLAIDTTNEKLYLSNAYGKVQRMNLDGSNYQTDLLIGLDAPTGLALDVLKGKVYWTEVPGRIRRAALDGSNVEDVVTNLGSAANIVLQIMSVRSGGGVAPERVSAIPDHTALLANYPNPFNPETWIPYQLSIDTDVRICIYDARGSLVRRLVLGHQSAGNYTSRGRAAYWDGRNDVGERVASGVYFYELQTDGVSSLRKVLILK